MPEHTHPALAPLVALRDDMAAESEELRATLPPVGPSRIAHLYRATALSVSSDELTAAIAEASALLGEVREETDDVFWGRLLGDNDPCAPGKDWAAAAFTDAEPKREGSEESP